MAGLVVEGLGLGVEDMGVGVAVLELAGGVDLVLPLSNI